MGIKKRGHIIFYLHAFLYLVLCFSVSLSPTHTHFLALSHTLSIFLTLSLFLSHSLYHPSHTHTLSLTYRSSLSLSLFLSTSCSFLCSFHSSSVSFNFSPHIYRKTIIPYVCSITSSRLSLCELCRLMYDNEIDGLNLFSISGPSYANLNRFPKRGNIEELLFVREVLSYIHSLLTT